MSFTASLDQIVAENANILLGSRPGWKRVRLKEVASILNGFPFPSANFTKNEGAPLLRIRDIVPGRTQTFYEGDYDPTYLVQPGELVVGMDGDFNCALWAGPRALLNQRVCKITPDESRYSKRFLLHVLPGYLAAINASTPSLTVKHLSSRTVAEIPLPCPPLSEQVEIADKLDEQLTRLDAGVAALKRLQANLKRYRAAVLKAACEGRLVPTEAEVARQEGRSYEPASALLDRILADQEVERAALVGQSPKKRRYQRPSAPQPGSQELPEGWIWTGIDQLAAGAPNAIKAGPFGSALKKSSYVPSGFKIYGQEQVIRGDATFGDYYISKGLYQDLRSYAVVPGDILLSLVGTAGRVLVLPDGAEPGIINPRLIKLTLHRTGVDRRFIAMQIKSPTTRVFFRGSAHGQTMDVINLSMLRQLPIALPPVAEQRRVVAEVERRLSIADELEHIVTANLHRAMRLRQSVLRAAFSGSLAPNAATAGGKPAGEEGG
jgi:type I restriction enzyme S subunit